MLPIGPPTMTTLDVRALRDQLESQGISSDAYCLTGGVPNEKYCLERTSGRWHVYYAERGQRTGLREFDTETAACKFLLDQLLGDETTTGSGS